LKRKAEERDDDFIVEASEKAILDKVLSQKKKKLNQLLVVRVYIL